MKRVFLLVIIVLLLTGCTSIENSDIDSLINSSMNSLVKTTNVYRKGYRYYLPRGISIRLSKSFNETLTDTIYDFYMYVDIVSYYNKTKFEYQVNNDAYYSKKIENNGKSGYIEINNYKDNQYLVEIMYNYAKIETVVYERDIKKSVAYALVILSSVTYNDNVIKSYLAKSIFNGNEEEFDIFKVTGSDNYLQITEYYESDTKNEDPDYIN